MKPFYTSVLAILATVTIVGMLTMGTQQASAFGFVERKEFKKLTNEFEKDVLDAVDKYSDDVKDLFREPSTSP